MKFNNSIYFKIIIALLGYTYSIAQTVNTGDLTVATGTVISTVSDFVNTENGVFINDGETFIYAHFKNEGMVDHTETTGTTYFQGTAVQQISGGSISYFYNVYFDNDASETASFELSNEISIANEATFNEGIVKNDDFGGRFIFENNAGHNGTYDGSHVDGLVQKIGDNSFEYPIGDVQLFRYAAISAPGSANDVFSAKYFLETTNDKYPVANLGPNLELIDNSEHWIIERTSGESDVLITLSWSLDTTPLAILDSPLEAIHIARWGPINQLWVDEGGAVDENARTVTAAAERGKIWVYRNGAKLIYAVDFTVTADTVTVTGTTDFTIFLDDVFEV